ncbi:MULTISPECIES: hypothetical protein [unclassified Raoultella]|jgi:hypothetical protein
MDGNIRFPRRRLAEMQQPAATVAAFAAAHRRRLKPNPLILII